jgi:hypothetical protein
MRLSDSQAIGLLFLIAESEFPIKPLLPRRLAGTQRLHAGCQRTSTREGKDAAME